MRTASRKMFEVSKLSSPNGKNWWKIEGRPTGRRERYYFKNEREAKKGAADRNNQIVAFGSQNTLPDSDRVMAAECIRRLAGYHKSLTDATNFYLDYLERQESSIDVADLCDRILDEFQRRLESQEISQRHNKSMRETVKKFRGQFAEKPIKLLDATTVKSWLASLPLAIKTRNRHLGYLKNIFGIALEWGLLDSDPFHKISSFNDPNARTLKISILTPDEMTVFLAVADPEFIPYFVLSAFTGLRREEITRLDWSEVKLDRNLIDLPFTKSKNRKRKLIEVPENLAAWLKPYERPEGSVLPHKKLQTALAAAAREARIIPWRQNCLRHSFCSYSVAARGFEWTAAQADHSVRMLREHYWEVVSKEDAERYWSIRPS